jgi:hypothetical protein
VDSTVHDLLFRREQPYFYAFDVLAIDGEDLTGLPLLKRKRRLRSIMPTIECRLLHLDWIGARTAVMLVQNFRPETRSGTDFEEFAVRLGAKPGRAGICETACLQPVRLMLAWADSPLATDAQIASLL